MPVTHASTRNSHAFCKELSLLRFQGRDKSYTNTHNVTLHLPINYAKMPNWRDSYCLSPLLLHAHSKALSLSTASGCRHHSRMPFGIFSDPIYEETSTGNTSRNASHICHSESKIFHFSHANTTSCWSIILWGKGVLNCVTNRFRESLACGSMRLSSKDPSRSVTWILLMTRSDRLMISSFTSCTERAFCLPESDACWWEVVIGSVKGEGEKLINDEAQTGKKEDDDEELKGKINSSNESERVRRVPIALYTL